MKRYLFLGLVSIIGALLVAGAITGYLVIAGNSPSAEDTSAVHEEPTPPRPLKPLPDVDAMARRLPGNQAVYEKVRDETLAVFANRHPGLHAEDDEARQELKLMAYLWTWGDFYGENLLPVLGDHAKHLNRGALTDPVWITANDIDLYDDHTSDCAADVERVKRHAEDLGKAGYSAAFQMRAWETVMADLVAGKRHAEWQAALTPALATMPDIVTHMTSCYGELVAQHLPNPVLYEKGRELISDSMHDLATMELVSKGLDDAFTAFDRANATAEALDALFYIDKAWAARGGGYSDTVSQEGWKIFGENMRHAGDMLNDLYTRAPDQPGLARCMMNVVQSLEQPRDQMELWFGRAMKTDPDDFQACKLKEYYLLPRWYGTEEDEWTFGKECVQGGRWAAKIPMIIVEELDYRTQSEPDVFGQDEVWGPMEKIFREFLSRYPDSVYYRSTFAQDAARGGHWDVVKEQLKILGDDYSRDVFSAKDFAQLKQQAAAH